MIAITGAAGFVGANLVRRFNREGNSALILVDHPLTTAKTPNLMGLPSFHFVEHLEFVEQLERDDLAPQAIFHLGACSDTTETDWNYLVANNVVYSQRLWRWCARKGVPFVYASSAATYGDGSLGFDDCTPPDKLRPLNLYGKSKNDFDIWVCQSVQNGEPAPPTWAGFKFFNVYGPHESHKGRMASMVWHGYHQILKSGEVALFKSDDPSLPDGGHRRDFVFVEDCIDHMIWLSKHPEASGIYNSGTGQARSFRDLIFAIFDALGREPKLRFIEMPIDLRGRYQSYTQAAVAKLRKAGYGSQATPIELGVARYISEIHAASSDLVP